MRIKIKIKIKFNKMDIPPNKLSRQQMNMVQLAVDEAIKSKLSFRVGAVLCYAGVKIIGGFNYHGNNVQNPYGYNHNVCAIHAEMGVCMDYYQKIKKDMKSFRDIKKFILCVVRRNKSGNLRNAKPCMECAEYLKKWMPCKILYSTDEGFFFGKISDLDSDHLSYVQMKRRSSPNGRLSPTRNVTPPPPDEDDE